MSVKHSLQQYFDSYEKGYNNSTASKYLSKRNPKLWSQILELTSFLPLDSKPKQRCWHVLSDTFERPRCPVTNEFTKWHLSRYLEYSSPKARANCEKSKNKRIKTCLSKYRVDNPSKSDQVKSKQKQTNIERYGTTSPLSSDEIKTKIDKTNLEKYGTTNPGTLPEFVRKKEETNKSRYGYHTPLSNREVRKKILKTKQERGLIRSKEQITEQERYYAEVEFWTQYSWYYFYSVINPNGCNRSLREYHLDHKFSRIEGFRQGIDPKIIGHWVNLEMLWCDDNNGKCGSCSITKDALLSLYYRETNNKKLL